MLHRPISELVMQGPKLNTASLDLRPLYYFVQVAELGSFSRAAAALSMGQPIVSRFIRRLEDELQVQLFHRHGRGVQLTEAGERLLEHSRAILRSLSQARTEIIALGGVPVGSVTIAMLPLFGHILAVDLLRRLRSDYPLITIHIREGYAADTIEWLSSGDVDIGIAYNVPNIATLLIEHLLDDQIHLVGAPGSLDVVPGQGVPASRLADLGLILPPAPHRLRAIIQEAAHQAGVELKIEAEVSGISTLLELVRARLGYTVLPSTLLRGDVEEGRLQSWPIVAPSISPRLFLATSMQRPHTMATKIVLRAISETFARQRTG
ncbi:MAG: LysR family transcriptional regulator [Proteobacteria bacterium]|nr:MAG: LysR family transcriptional regulator [Pseudomonadota bacterium]